MQVILNHTTKSRRRSACSHRDGDFPFGDILRLLAISLESSFKVIPEPFASFDELVIICVGEGNDPRAASQLSWLISEHLVLRWDGQKVMKFLWNNSTSSYYYPAPKQ